MAVEFANIDIVDGADPINDLPTVSIAAGQGTAGFHVESGASNGLFPIRIGADATDDAANGVLLGYVRETGRNQLDSMGGIETLYATSSSSRRSDGSFSLAARRAGDDSVNPDTLFASGTAFNANLAAAYFPFSEGWMGGTVYNMSNGTILNEFVGSPGLSLAANFQQDAFGIGDNLVTLPGVTDSRRQGLLFVGGGKSEGNYALSEPTENGSGFNVTVHDNAKGGSAGEVDPVSFLFVPLGTPNITMARVNTRGFGPSPEPVAMISSGDDFTVTRSNPGEYRLSIDGQTPSTGTLLVSPSGTNNGVGGRNSDNIVTYEADGNDWVILSQDLAELSGAGQDSGVGAESYFSFAFLPFNTPPTAPAAIPAVETLTNFSTQRVLGWNAEVIATTGDMYVNVNNATSDVSVLPLFEDRGDNGFAVDGAFLGSGEGVLFVTVSEGIRDNSIAGSSFGYGIAAADANGNNEWFVRTATADPVINSEFDVNFSVAFFGADSGFEMAQGVTADATTAMVDVAISGVNSLTDGVLIANAAGNDDNFPTATPRPDGSGWDITLFDNSTILEGGAASGAEPNNVNYIFLPYDADNLIAGRVDEDGTLASSTDTSEFTLTRTDDGEYLLSIVGKTPEDGMLLLTSTGEGDSVDNVLVYEADGDDFLILGLDMITVDDANINGDIVDLEDTSFMFAYIDFEEAPELNEGQEGDFDDDGDVDGADFLAWQRGESPNGATAGDLAAWQSNYGPEGLFTASAAVVPEPSTVMLVSVSMALLLILPGRRTNSLSN